MCIASWKTVVVKALYEISQNSVSLQHTDSWLNPIKPAQRWVMGSATGLYVPPPPHSPCFTSRPARIPRLSQDNVPQPKPPSQMNIHYRSFLRIFSWIRLPRRPSSSPLLPWQSWLREREEVGWVKGRLGLVTPRGLRHVCTISISFVCRFLRETL